MGTVIVNSVKHLEPEQEVREQSLPTEPTEQQRLLHGLVHLPYQAWCDLCVQAKGRDDVNLRGHAEHVGRVHAS